MTLKEQIIWNGANPEDYSVAQCKQIKFLLSGRLHAWAAHKQLVEKFGFQCVSDRPCFHPQPKLTLEEMNKVLLELNELPEELFTGVKN